MQQFAMKVAEGMVPRQACLAVGYSKAYASGKYVDLLQHPGVRREIRKALARMWKKHEIRLNRAMQILGDALEARVSDYVDPETGQMLKPNELPERIDNVTDSYEEEITYTKKGEPIVKRRYKKASKLQAVELAMKIKGAFAPTKSINANVGVDFSDLYGMPPGALDADVIEVKATKKED